MSADPRAPCGSDSAKISSAPLCLSGVSFTDIKLTGRSKPVPPSPPPSSYTHPRQSQPHTSAPQPRGRLAPRPTLHTPHRPAQRPRPRPAEGPWPRPAAGHSRSRPERGSPAAAGAERGRGAARAAGGAAGRARRPRLPSGLALMKTRTLLPLGTRWDGSAERFPENAARRSAASRGQGGLPPAPAGHIPRGRPPAHSGPRSAAAAPAAPATGRRAAAIRTLGLPGAAARPRGVGAAGAVAAARRWSGASEERTRRPLPCGGPRTGGRGRKSLRRSGAGRGGDCGGRRTPGTAESGGSAVCPAGPSGSPPPPRACGVQSGNASGGTDGAFAPPSVSQLRDRIFIGKLLPAHPLGSEEFRALPVFRNLPHRSPTCSDTKE